MTSDQSLAELRDFASRIGLRREWEQCSRKGLVHYDVWGARVEAAFRNGAVRTPTKEMAKRCIRLVGGKRPFKADARAALAKSRTRHQ